MERDLWHTRLKNSLEELDRAHLRRTRREVTGSHGSVDSAAMLETNRDGLEKCLVDGHPCLSFATNDYLGLSRHPLVLAAFATAAATQFGSGASPLIAGRTSEMVQLEQALAEFECTESAVVFPSGFAANFGTLTSIINEGDAVFCDRDNHASLVDGCRASAGRFFIYDRSNMDAFRDSLHRRRDEYKTTWIVTDSVFSMDGSVADLQTLCNIADDHRALVVVDEAHGTGVFGEHCRGVCEMQGVEDRVSVRIGTLSKALGGLGGFVAGPTVLCDWLWNRARSHFFSTALPPAVCAAASAAIGVVQNDLDRRERLKARSKSFREMLRHFRLTVFPAPAESPIVGVLMEHDAKAVEASAQLLCRGIFAPAVRPPTVPSGTARLRFSLTCEHSESQLQYAANQLRDVLAAIS